MFIDETKTKETQVEGILKRRGDEGWARVQTEV